MRGSPKRGFGRAPMSMDDHLGWSAAQSPPSGEPKPRGERAPGDTWVPRLGRFRFKVADTDLELDQVHQLNYRPFVREIPHHADNGTGRLVDKFHEWNTYFLALLDERVIGMISVHDRAPFSMESRLLDRSVIQ